MLMNAWIQMQWVGRPNGVAATYYVISLHRSAVQPCIALVATLNPFR